MGSCPIGVFGRDFRLSTDSLPTVAHMPTRAPFALAAVTGLLAVALAACDPSATGSRPPGAAPASGELAGDGSVQACGLDSPPPPETVPKPPGTALFLPEAPAYPYGDPAELTAQAQCLSDAFEAYVEAWLAGRAPAEIPAELLPPGHNQADFPSFRLVAADEIDPARQWAIRPADEIDEAALYGAFPDPHATYLVVPALYAPFGTTVVVEGEFPHARFFDIQLTPSFDPRSYRYDGGIGVGEVPIVDADIDPVPGHVNPFRVGADRTATDRSYRVEYELAVGDPVELNPAFRPPDFRDAGNRRIGGAILFQGPWGVPGGPGHGRGVWDAGQLWLRYYAPDRERGPLAGVGLPRVTFELPDGRQYFVEADIGPFVERVNRPVALDDYSAATPTSSQQDTEEFGWFKQTGIFRAIVQGLSAGTGWADEEYVRQLDAGVAGRGAGLGPPNDYEQSATSATYLDYLVRGASLVDGGVVVLRGRLPTYPATRGGEPVMAGGQARYWSLTGYRVPRGLEWFEVLNPDVPQGVAVHSVMDDELVLDAARDYTLVLSRPRDRPANATAANGVTWVDWGRAGQVSWTLRWLSVGPEWQGPMTPSPARLGWQADPVATAFDPDVISRNDHRGALGPYLPTVEYLTTAEFEARG